MAENGRTEEKKCFSQNEGVHTESRGRVKAKNWKNLNS